MKHTSDERKNAATPPRDEPPREGDDERERRSERDRRIGAAQMAAPSTRTWRRAGRFQ